MGVWKSGMQPMFLPFGSGKYQYDNLHWKYPISGPKSKPAKLRPFGPDWYTDFRKAVVRTFQLKVGRSVATYQGVRYITETQQEHTRRPWYVLGIQLIYIDTYIVLSKCQILYVYTVYIYIYTYVVRMWESCIPLLVWSSIHQSLPGNCCCLAAFLPFHFRKRIGYAAMPPSFVHVSSMRRWKPEVWDRYCRATCPSKVRICSNKPERFRSQTRSVYSWPPREIDLSQPVQEIYTVWVPKYCTPAVWQTWNNLAFACIWRDFGLLGHFKKHSMSAETSPILLQWNFSAGSWEFEVNITWKHRRSVWCFWLHFGQIPNKNQNHRVA